MAYGGIRKFPRSFFFACQFENSYRPAFSRTLNPHPHPHPLENSWISPWRIPFIYGAFNLESYQYCCVKWNVRISAALSSRILVSFIHSHVGMNFELTYAHFQSILLFMYITTVYCGIVVCRISTEVGSLVAVTWPLTLQRVTLGADLSTAVTM